MPKPVRPLRMIELIAALAMVAIAVAVLLPRCSAPPKIDTPHAASDS